MRPATSSNQALTARSRWNETFPVPAECQNSDDCVENRCGSDGFCRDKVCPLGSDLDKISDYFCSCNPGYERGSSAEYTHDYSRKSCCMPVSIGNVIHAPSSAMKFEDTAIYECHNGYNLDDTVDSNRNFVSMSCCFGLVLFGLSVPGSDNKRAVRR